MQDMHRVVQEQGGEESAGGKDLGVIAFCYIGDTKPLSIEEKDVYTPGHLLLLLVQALMLGCMSAVRGGGGGGGEDGGRG